MHIWIGTKAMNHYCTSKLRLVSLAIMHCMTYTNRRQTSNTVLKAIFSPENTQTTNATCFIKVTTAVY